MDSAGASYVKQLQGGGPEPLCCGGLAARVFTESVQDDSVAYAREQPQSIHHRNSLVLPLDSF